nr:hypothetical protein [uncultured Methylotenera sp.]
MAHLFYSRPDKSKIHPMQSDHMALQTLNAMRILPSASLIDDLTKPSS